MKVFETVLIVTIAALVTIASVCALNILYTKEVPSRYTEEQAVRCDCCPYCDCEIIKER